MYILYIKILGLSRWLIFPPRIICVGLIIFWKTVAFRYNNNNNSIPVMPSLGSAHLSMFIVLTILIWKVTWWSFDCWLGPPGHQPRWLNCSNSWLHHQH